MSTLDVTYILERMVRHCADIGADIAGFCASKYERTGAIQRAVHMSLSQIGELSGRLPIDFRKLHAELPYVQMRQTRNVIVHDYVTIDTTIIYNTITEDIPLLKRELEQIIASINAGNEPRLYEK